MAEPVAATGQAAKTDPKGATAAAPSSTQGQPPAPSQTTAAGTGSGDVESFFDPKSIDHSPELKAAYKQMQGKWTKEMQRFKEHGKKIEAYDSIVSNPMAAVQQYAQANGYTLVQKDPKAKEGDDTPKTWADVYARAKEESLKELQPLVSEVRQLKQQNVEQYLDNEYPDWRTFEPEMMDKLKRHPTLAGDMDTLYQVALPEAVRESRAMKAAQAKLLATSEAGQISGASAATKQTTTNAPPKGASFNDYVEWAKQKLARDGIRPGVG